MDGWKLMAKAVQNFSKHLQACMNKVRGHFEHSFETFNTASLVII